MQKSLLIMKKVVSEYNSAISSSTEDKSVSIQA